MTPSLLPSLAKAGWQATVQAGAGAAAGFADDDYREKGAQIVADRAAAVAAADAVLQVRTLGANLERGRDDLSLFKPEQLVIGLCDPLSQPGVVQELANRRVALFALELIPRITRAQSMDVLSSMATVAGYRAVLLAAYRLPKLFPLLMTAAGTIKPAKVLVIGAGVAGLQAIATARRLGAVVSAYDVRAAVKEQIESLGAKFVELKLSTGDAEDRGGYAKALSDEQQLLQREQLALVVGEQDVVVSTAAIPGKRSPLLVTADAVRRMRPGSVIVDLAAERGGNCELTQPDQEATDHGVTILGPTNLAAEAPYDASQMFAKNVATLLQLLTKKGELDIDLRDEVIRETLTTRDGQVQPPRLRELLGLPPLVLPDAAPPTNHLAAQTNQAPMTKHQ